MVLYSLNDKLLLDVLTNFVTTMVFSIVYHKLLSNLSNENDNQSFTLKDNGCFEM
jgi:hypothetical protein